MAYGTSNEHATRCAKTLSATRKDTPCGFGRTVVGYEVQQYHGASAQVARPLPEGERWGVVERWVYDDRPDLGVFGGAYVWL